jgi:hypothetical protein
MDCTIIRCDSSSPALVMSCRSSSDSPIPGFQHYPSFRSRSNIQPQFEAQCHPGDPATTPARSTQHPAKSICSGGQTIARLRSCPPSASSPSMACWCVHVDLSGVLIGRSSLFTWRLSLGWGIQDGEGELVYHGWFNLRRTVDQEIALSRDWSVLNQRRHGGRMDGGTLYALWSPNKWLAS